MSPIVHTQGSNIINYTAESRHGREINLTHDSTFKDNDELVVIEPQTSEAFPTREAPRILAPEEIETGHFPN